jgi:hypothetical protein
LWWRLYDQDWADGVTHHCLGGRTKDNSSQAGAAMGRNYNQINLALAGNAYNLGGGVAVDNLLFDFQTVEVIAFGKLRQFPLGRVF